VKIKHFKATHSRKDGKFYDLEIYAQLVQNGEDEFLAITGLDASHSSFYHKISDFTENYFKVGGWKLNLQDQSLIATPTALQIMEKALAEELHPHLLTSQFRNAEDFRRGHIELMRSGSDIDMVLETEKHPKKYIRAIAQAKMKGGKVYKVLGAYQDVTEETRRSKELLLNAAIIDNSQDLVYLYNRKGELLYYNQAVVNTLGFSREELDSFSIFDLDTNIDAEWWEQHFQTIIKEKAVHLEWYVPLKDGTRMAVDIVANHIIHDGEDLNCAIIRDIRDRKSREIELREALLQIENLKNQLEKENQQLQEELKSKSGFQSIISRSENYAKVLEQVSLVAPTDVPVLITGESGTGKELLAEAVHESSKRESKVLIKVNAANLSKELFESELFGHRKGAFTGAIEDKVGKFKLADGGSLFLDEIGEVPLEVQAKLLRVLQDSEFSEVGGNKTHKVNVRIIAATNRDLAKMVSEGSFREDLYYRLNVFPIHNIPLRDRSDDIPLLADLFLKKYARQTGKYFKRIGKKALESLMEYDFPGNVRELENLIARAVILEQGPSLKAGSWIPKAKRGSSSNEGFVSLEELSRNYIIEVLEHTNWRITGPKGAARILGMNDKTLYTRLGKLGISRTATT